MQGMSFKEVDTVEGYNITGEDNKLCRKMKGQSFEEVDTFEGYKITGEYNKLYRKRKGQSFKEIDKGYRKTEEDYNLCSKMADKIINEIKVDKGDMITVEDHKM